MLTRGFNTGGAALKRETFEDAARWGANNMRVHLKAPVKSKPENYWKDFEATVEDAALAVSNAQGTGIKVVLTIGSFIPGLNRDKNEYWTHPDLEKYHVEAWRRIVRRVAPMRAHILGYDLMNEPLDRSVAPKAPATWRELAIKITKAIREIDPDTWVIFEPGPGGTFSGFFDLEPLPDAKVIYSGHYYFPHMFTHQGVWNVKNTELTQAMAQVNLNYPFPVETLKKDRWELDFQRTPDLAVFDKEAIARICAPLLAFQAKHRVPIYLGEFSVIRWAPKESALRYLKDLTEFWEAHGWSWSYHAFREFNGWSLEYGDTLDWIDGMPQPPLSPVLTDRARLMLGYLAKNAGVKQDLPYIEAQLAREAEKVKRSQSSDHRYTFSTVEAFMQWTLTARTEFVLEGPESSRVGRILGQTWDSKLFRSLTLKAGAYVLSASAGGKLAIYLNKSGDWKSRDHQLLWKDATERSQETRFNVEAGNYVLVIHPDGPKGDAFIRTLSLERAP